MLKNKKTVYILIPLNLLIWGFFAYRFYTAFNQSDVPTLKSHNIVLNTGSEKDSVQYTLKLNYLDPFLKHSAKQVAHNKIPDVPSTLQKPVNAVKSPTAPPKALPEIKYMGLIKNTSSGASTALVSVNGSSKLVKQQEVVEGICFKTFTRDSLVVKYGKDIIVVRK